MKYYFGVVVLMCMDVCTRLDHQMYLLDAWLQCIGFSCVPMSDMQERGYTCNCPECNLLCVGNSLGGLGWLNFRNLKGLDLFLWRFGCVGLP